MPYRLRGTPQGVSTLLELAMGQEAVGQAPLLPTLFLPLHIRPRAYHGQVFSEKENEMRLPEIKDWHFDIDDYLKPYIPRNLVYRLPRPLSHLLGHRDTPLREIGNILVAGWALLGAFAGVVVIEAVFMAPIIKPHGVPLLIASFVCLVLSISLVYSMLTYTGRCSESRVQHYQVTARSASKRHARTHHFRGRWRWHYKALQA